VLKVEVNWEDGVLIMQLIQLLRGKKTIYLYKYKYDLKIFKFLNQIKDGNEMKVVQL